MAGGTLVSHTKGSRVEQVGAQRIEILQGGIKRIIGSLGVFISLSARQIVQAKTFIWKG